MSTQSNHYIILGVKIPYTNDDDWYEAHRDYMDSAFDGIHHHKGLTVLYDGRSGKYIMVGRVLIKKEDWKGFDEPTPLDLATETEKELVGELITQQFGIESPDVKLWAITHLR